MHGGISHKCLSVRPSVCQTRELWQNERNLFPHFIPYERMITGGILVFRHEEKLMGRQPLLHEILGQNDPIGAKTPIFKRYSLVALKKFNYH